MLIGVLLFSYESKYTANRLAFWNEDIRSEHSPASYDLTTFIQHTQYVVWVRVARLLYEPNSSHATSLYPIFNVNTFNFIVKMIRFIVCCYCSHFGEMIARLYIAALTTFMRHSLTHSLTLPFVRGERKFLVFHCGFCMISFPFWPLLHPPAWFCILSRMPL